MSVSSIFSSASTTDPLSVLTAPSTTASGASSSSASLLTSAASATSVSSDASLLAQLQQLSFTNPAAFKTATANIAAQLQTDAQQTGGSQGQALSSLAAKFQQASQTGNLSSLTPAHGRHGGHHHSSGGSSASAAAAYQQNTDAFGAASTSADGSSVSSQVSDILGQALTQNSSASTALAAPALDAG